ncbi:MAG: pirin family protein [Flavobacteriales bacterium]
MNTTTTTGRLTLHRAADRGHADHGWLDAWHSFSFASWYDPAKVHFGTLRVLNDDTIAGGMGFGMHPHDNMEIITIPLEGALQHKDSMGNTAVIKTGDVQVMSAGTGVRHSEFNPDHAHPTKLLQIWLFPHTRNVTPRYDQITLDPAERQDRFQQIVSPDANDAGTWIHQHAWLHLGRFGAERSERYSVKREGNGVYAFVIRGSATINGQELNTRDALGVEGTDTLAITTGADGADILLLDVPMHVH